MAPEMMAPHISPMLMPRLWARGSSTETTAVTEPVEVPAGSGDNTQAKKPTRGNPAGVQAQTRVMPASARR